jgi:hypothetical protein
MYSGEQLKAFRKHWNYTPNDAQELTRFRIRVNEVLDRAWDEYFEAYDRARKKFALISGTPYLNWDRKSYAYTSLSRTLDGDNEPSLYEITEAIQFVLWTLQDEDTSGLTDVCRWLTTALDASPGIPVRLVNQNGTARLYPMGAQLLDEAVIEDNLAWLYQYPEAAKPFDDALKIYSRKDPSQYRNLLDNLRLSVEQMLRAVLNNGKSLENQKQEFLVWLKANDAHSQIANIYHDLLFGKFAQYQNDAVKHHEDQYTLAEVEFVLYLTGTLLRFIQRAAEQKKSVASTS